MAKHLRASSSLTVGRSPGRPKSENENTEKFPQHCCRCIKSSWFSLPLESAVGVLACVLNHFHLSPMQESWRVAKLGKEAQVEIEIRIEPPQVKTANALRWLYNVILLYGSFISMVIYFFISPR